MDVYIYRETLKIYLYSLFLIMNNMFANIANNKKLVNYYLEIIL